MEKIIKWSYQWKKYLLFSILVVTSLMAKGQMDTRESEQKNFYGTNITHNLNGLVLNRTVMGGQYQLGRRTFEVGILLNEFKNASGFVFKHRYFLNSTREGEVYNPASYNVRPHVFYRFVYNNRMPENYLNRPMNPKDIGFGISPGNTFHTINTIEHYLGIGIEIDLVNNIYLNTSVSGGFYFFKDNNSAVKINDQLVPEASTGFVFNVSSGIGFTF